MREIYKFINDFDIEAALNLCQSKYPQVFCDMLFECALFERLLHFLQSQNIAFIDSRGGGQNTNLSY